MTEEQQKAYLERIETRFVRVLEAIMAFRDDPETPKELGQKLWEQVREAHDGPRPTS